jgi:hypothetical protein
MKSSLAISGTIATLLQIHPATSRADESMATLKDPHGSVEVACDGDSKMTLKGGEHFLAARITNGWSVYLKSGCDGYIKKADLQLLPNEPLMKLNYDRRKKLWQKRQSVPAEGNEEASSAKERGFNYYAILTAASNGDLKAMATFFSFARFMDGGAADGYYPETWELLHVVGDETFARFLRGQPGEVRKRISGTFSEPGDTEPISKPKPYLKQNFPKTYKILFSGER